MAAHLFYPEDTVSLKTDPRKTGDVERTHGIVDTHTPDPLGAYGEYLEKHALVPTDQYTQFLQSGIPPRGTVLVTWSFLPWSHRGETTLIREADLQLVDRALLLGDVVKRSPQEAAMGVVIQAATRVTLLQPSKWPSRGLGPSHDPRSSPYSAYSTTAAHDLLYNVPSEELRPTMPLHIDDFVFHRGWVGRITDVEEEPLIRLENNSVVVPQDPSLVETWTLDTDEFEVGNFVSTRKANLRLGRWIYGAFNASVLPEGFVADIRQISVGVDWKRTIVGDLGGQASSEPPSPELDMDDLQSGNVHVYDRRTRPVGVGSERATRINFELTAGDHVRFCSLPEAGRKYNGSTSQGTLRPIPRTETLGYDLNVFLVASTRTTLDILWQDGAVSRDLDALDLVPYFDVDDELEPGSLVGEKRHSSANGPDDDIVTSGDETSSRVGVVQSVRAEDQVGIVRWMKKAHKDGDTNIVSLTAALHEEAEELSLYDVNTNVGLDMRLGDFVAIHPPVRGTPAQDDNAALARYDDVHWACDASKSGPYGWFGEVIELGLDGLLTVRVAAAAVVRDLKVPWENAEVVWKGDEDGSTEDGSYDDGSSEDSFSDEDMLIYQEALEANRANNERRDEDMLLWQETLEAHRVNNERPVVTSAMFNDQVARTGRPVVIAFEDEDASMDSWETDDDPLDDSDSANGEGREDDLTDEVPFEGDADADRDSDGVYWDAQRDIIMSEDEGPSADARQPRDLDTTSPGGGSEAFSYLELFDRAPSRERIPAFEILEGSLPADHKWSSASHQVDGQQLRRIHKEHKILASSLPAGSFVRTWESSLDCMRILLLGPIGTPYEYAPFVFDLYLDSMFPSSPPLLHFHSWTGSQGPCNPNLYEDGKVCLSLLGTWPGDDKSDSWSNRSTLLQVIVSLSGLVLVKDPYYNEAGFEVRRGTEETKVPARLYAERAYVRTRAFVTHALRNAVPGFDAEIRRLYLTDGVLMGEVIASALRVARNSRREASERDATQLVLSAGALVPLCRQIEELIGSVTTSATGNAGGDDVASRFRQSLKDVR